MTDHNTQFMAVLTAVGEARQANANALGIPWVITQMGVGDANGTDPVPSRSQTALINERRRAALNQLSIDPNNPAIIIAEQVIPEDVGGWWIREVGLYDAAGDLVAVANCPPTFKPELAQGSGRTQVVRLNIQVTSAENIQLKIDPSVVLATRQYADLLLAWHNALADPHPQYKMYADDLMDDHLNEEDPHPDYNLTPERLAAIMQPEHTAEATLTGIDNVIAMPGIVEALRLEVGDVIQFVSGAGDNNERLHTVEAITDEDTIVVNHEHCGGRGDGSLKLFDTTGEIKIKRIEKWHAASDGLGQAWVDVTGLRVTGTIYSPPSNRTISVVVCRGGSVNVPLTAAVDSTVVLSVSPSGSSNIIYSATFDAPVGSQNYTVTLSNIGRWTELR